MQTFCQWVLLMVLVIGFIGSTKQDFDRGSEGFAYFIVGTVFFILLGLVHWGAGSFSILFG